MKTAMACSYGILILIMASFFALHGLAVAQTEESPAEGNKKPKIQTVQVKIVKETTTRRSSGNGAETFPETTGPATETSAEMASAQANIDKNIRENFPQLQKDSFVEAGMKMPFLEPPVNMEDRGDSIVITMDIPGMNKEDMKISVVDGLLTVKGKREVRAEERTEDKKGKIYRRERFEGDFEKSLQLPRSVDDNSIQANYENGVLTICATKADSQDSNPKEITIQ